MLTFREVARQRSFSRAAAALALTQPAVSQQIRALELQLGERLIERGRPGFALTPAGELLAAHADALHERLQLAERQVAEEIAGVRRMLRVGAFPSAIATLVPRALATLTEQSDALEASVVQGSTERLVADVRSGELHVALCFQDAAQPRREHEGARRVEVLEEPMVAVVGSGHRLAARKRIQLVDLAGETWTAATRGGLIERACVEAGFEPRIAYLTDDPLAIGALVAGGLAVTLTPRLLAGKLQGVATPSLAGVPVRRAIYAVTPSAGEHALVAPFLRAMRA